MIEIKFNKYFASAYFPECFLNPEKCYAIKNIGEIVIGKQGWVSSEKRIHIPTLNVVGALFELYLKEEHNKASEYGWNSIEGFIWWVTNILPSAYPEWQTEIWKEVVREPDTTLYLLKLDPKSGFFNKVCEIAHKLDE